MGAAWKRSGAEQMVNVLRQIEVLQANGKRLPEACKAAGLPSRRTTLGAKPTGGLNFGQVKRLKELEAENARLKRVVADFVLREATLKEVAMGNFQPPDAGTRRSRASSRR